MNSKSTFFFPSHDRLNAHGRTNTHRDWRTPLAGLLFVTACVTEDVPLDIPPPLAGGATTIADQTSSAFENPAPNLSTEDLERHLDGDVAFESTFVTSPATVNAGLGPYYNNRACGNCHIGDGRGLPVAGSDSEATQLLVRVSLPEGEPSVPGGSVPVPTLGTQIQDHAVYGTSPEAQVALNWSTISGSYPADGIFYVLNRVVPEITLSDGSLLSEDVQISLRLPPPVFGLGLLEAVSEQTLMNLEDPDDADSDGISGRANRVWDVALEEEVIGRFGWKAGNPTLQQQSAAAYFNDMGVSTPLFPEEDGSFEVDQKTLEDAAFYTQTLAVPMRRDWDNPTVVEGEGIFRVFGCTGCHVETFQTGDHEVEAVKFQTVHPYSDLLLHDMGPDLADNRPDFQASGTEWRTSPLWGIGLTATVLGQAAFLHDGRAKTLEEAILWHGGEAEAAREDFRMATERERDALLAFLRSL